MRRFLPLLCALLGAQTPQYVITTIAGSGSNGDGGPAISALLRSQSDVAVDATGNVYLPEVTDERVRRVAPDGTISTVAGAGNSNLAPPYGDGGPSTAARLFSPGYVAVDSAGNLYIANQRAIRRVSPDGKISRMAGTYDNSGSLEDGISATSARINAVGPLVADPSGNLYFCENAVDPLSFNAINRIRRISPDGIVTTLAPAANCGALAIDGAGNLYETNVGNHTILRITPQGTVTTFAGTGSPGFSGDGGRATAAQLLSPRGSLLIVPGAFISPMR